MKRIVIEISDEQHAQLQEHIEKGHKINLDNETFSGFGINLNCAEGFSWVEVDMYGKIEIGEVKWQII